MTIIFAPAASRWSMEDLITCAVVLGKMTLNTLLKTLSLLVSLLKLLKKIYITIIIIVVLRSGIENLDEFLKINALSYLTFCSLNKQPGATILNSLTANIQFGVSVLGLGNYSTLIDLKGIN